MPDVLVFQRKQFGLTLLEVLITVLMLAIITTLLTPNMSNYFYQANIKGAAEAFYDDVNLARTTATKSTNAVTLTATSGAAWCYGLYSAGSCACNSAASPSNCNLGVTTSANFKNTTLSMSPNSTMTFSTSRGSTTGSTAIFSGGGQTATITVNDMGTPSICSTNSTVGGYPAC